MVLAWLRGHGAVEGPDRGAADPAALRRVIGRIREGPTPIQLGIVVERRGLQEKFADAALPPAIVTGVVIGMSPGYSASRPPVRWRLSRRNTFPASRTRP